MYVPNTSFLCIVVSDQEYWRGHVQDLKIPGSNTGLLGGHTKRANHLANPALKITEIFFLLYFNFFSFFAFPR